ncbi:MAG: hypothetical protein JJU16_05210 [Alkalibacterium sp.]|nr:hypothetical protein [Alkalibacterium sp.]
MKLYLIWGETGDYYTPVDLYAVATTKEDAERLKEECIKSESKRTDGSTYLEYEDADIEETTANERW